MKFIVAALTLCYLLVYADGGIARERAPLHSAGPTIPREGFRLRRDLVVNEPKQKHFMVSNGMRPVNQDEDADVMPAHPQGFLENREAVEKDHTLPTLATLPTLSPRPKLHILPTSHSLSQDSLEDYDDEPHHILRNHKPYWYCFGTLGRKGYGSRGGWNRDFYRRRRRSAYPMHFPIPVAFISSLSYPRPSEPIPKGRNEIEGSR